MKKLLFFPFAFLTFLYLTKILLSYSVLVSLELNATRVEWNETINASGYTRNLDGTPWVGSVRIKIDNKTACTTTSNPDGFYTCLFNAPLEINNFEVVAYAISDSTILGKSESLTISVIYFYGGEKPTQNVAVLEAPLILQDLNGKINLVRANLKVWS